MTATVHEGGCLCRAVRYRARGTPSDATLCHCATCRKASGAPAVAWVTFAATAFAFTAGTPVELRSSPEVRRTFCGACGTPLTYRQTTAPADVDVTVGSLDDPGAYPPADHTWVRHALPWHDLRDGRPRFREARGTEAT